MKKFAAASVMALSMALAAFAVVDDHHHVSVNKNDVILNGYDAVAYFTMDKAVKGSSKYTADHGDATYQFSSAKHRDMFVANPEMYAPMYGGYCAYGTALGKKFAVNGEAFEVVDDKLYVNKDLSVYKKWKKDKPGYIAKAEKNWPKIVDTPAKEL